MPSGPKSSNCTSFTWWCDTLCRSRIQYSLQQSDCIWLDRCWASSYRNIQNSKVGILPVSQNKQRQPQRTWNLKSFQWFIPFEKSGERKRLPSHTPHNTFEILKSTIEKWRVLVPVGAQSRSTSHTGSIHCGAGWHGCPCYPGIPNPREQTVPRLCSDATENDKELGTCRIIIE